MQEKIYTKYKLTKEIYPDNASAIAKTITIYAKVSDKGISIRDQFDHEEFEFTCSKPAEARAVAELIIEATEL